MVKHYEVKVETEGCKVSYFDITKDVKGFIEKSGIKNGIVLVQTAHTTCSVFFEEYTHDVDDAGNDFLQLDLNNGLNKIFPKQTVDSTEYHYPGPIHKQFGLNIDPNVVLINADAHLKATLIGSSCSFSLLDGVLNTGEYGYIYFVDWDGTRPRKRKCCITIIGE